MNPLTLLKEKYPFLKIIIYSDSGMLKYQFKEEEKCSDIKKYDDLSDPIKNLKGAKLSTGEGCNIVIKIVLFDYTSIFYFYRDEIQNLKLEYTTFADSVFAKAIEELIISL